MKKESIKKREKPVNRILKRNLCKIMANRNAKISAIFSAKSEVANSIEFKIESCKNSIDSMKSDCTDENGNISMPEWTKETIAIYELKIEIWENLLKQI